MAIMLSKVYDALRSAQGISDQQAREAAEELAGYENRLGSIETRLAVLTWMVTFNLLLTVAILWKVFS